MFQKKFFSITGEMSANGGRFREIKTGWTGLLKLKGQVLNFSTPTFPFVIKSSGNTKRGNSDAENKKKPVEIMFQNIFWRKTHQKPTLPKRLSVLY